MEDEDGYMALDWRRKRGAAERPGPLRDAGPCMQDPEGGFALWWAPVPKGAPRCLLGALMAALVLSFVACVSWLLVERQRSLGAVGCGNESLGQSCATPGCAQLGLRKSLCPPGEGGGCKLCPMGWTLHRSKCFWVASRSRSWKESRENCTNLSAQLLMPEDQGELDFLNQIVQKPTRYFWIGLSLPSVGTGWTWLDGSPLDQSWFKLSTSNTSGGCGAVRGDRIISENCGSASAWICQKDAIQL